MISYATYGKLYSSFTNILTIGIRLFPNLLYEVVISKKRTCVRKTGGEWERSENIKQIEDYEKEKLKTSHTHIHNAKNSE